MGELGTKRTAPVDEAGNAAWHRFLDVMLAHKEQFTAKLAKYDLNPPQAFLLRSLTPEANVLMCHIASALSCDASNVTNLVDRLETRGLIERQADPSDRRVRRIVLTRAGAKLRAQLLADAFAPPVALWVLSATELKQFEQILQKILSAHLAGCECTD